VNPDWIRRYANGLGIQECAVKPLLVYRTPNDTWGTCNVLYVRIKIEPRKIVTKFLKILGTLN